VKQTNALDYLRGPGDGILMIVSSAPQQARAVEEREGRRAMEIISACSCQGTVHVLSQVLGAANASRELESFRIVWLSYRSLIGLSQAQPVALRRS
jgi:hypothetical protein